MKKILLFLILCVQVSFAQEMSLVKQNGKLGYIDKTGQFVIKPVYDKARSFSEGLAAVKDQKKWGFLDTKGQLLGNQWFENAELFK
ncbi:WG repeat-containing protein [Flavobacterium sp. NRK1]|uniref:WG repeat-containing protein n=1 Tax=Flavobacterium sp. NRK1 TaxID=2954929 RepID=UPI0020926F71|nr:WG repeat-containing protein [Flavobacterium sp. NRK1]MCO6147301.1 WG repeat-containing protein [Flavobacterium sp. NRK1]